VKDDNNYDFLTKLLINIGVVVPNPATVQAALAAVGKEHCLLGKAWAEQEGNLHRGLLQYAIRRANRNPDSRTGWRSL
ncbi:unnamed protein product, partial [Cladocopium goreaui]